MDYGTLLKKKHQNPARRSAHYLKQSAFEGSNRQIRGMIVKTLVAHKELTEPRLLKALKTDISKTRALLAKLHDEGLILKKGQRYVIA